MILKILYFVVASLFLFQSVTSQGYSKYIPGSFRNDCLRPDSAGSFPECDPLDDKCCIGLKCILFNGKNSNSESSQRKKSKEIFKCGNEIENTYYPVSRVEVDRGVSVENEKFSKFGVPLEEEKPYSRKERHLQQMLHMIALVLVGMCLGLNLYIAFERYGYNVIN